MYVGVTPEVSKELYRSHRRFVSTVRRSAARTLRRAAASASFLGAAGLALDAAETIFVGTKRALDFTSTEEPVNKTLKMTIHDGNTAGYNQRKRVSFTCGRPLPKNEKKMKILGAHMQTFIDRFNGAGNTLWEAGEPVPGWYRLDYANPGTGTGTLPCYLMELTGAFKNIAQDANATGVPEVYTSCPLMQLTRNNADPYTYAFESRQGRNADNSGDVNTWQIERQPNNISMEVGDKGFIGSVDIRMNIFGANKAPTRVHVQLIQFVDDDLCPGVYGFANTRGVLDTIEADSSSDYASNREKFNRWQNFWMSETDRLICNPIAKRGVKTGEKGYNVLFSRTMDFEPQMTTEADQTPHNVEFFLRYNMDKVLDYVRNPEVKAVTTAEAENANEWDTTSGTKTSIACAPKGRVYLKITGEVVKNSNYLDAGERAGDYAPSFDLIVRRKHTAIKFAA